VKPKQKYAYDYARKIISFVTNKEKSGKIFIYEMEIILGSPCIDYVEEKMLK
jgi:hypothetical protein